MSKRRDRHPYLGHPADALDAGLAPDHVEPADHTTVWSRLLGRARAVRRRLRQRSSSQAGTPSGQAGSPLTGLPVGKDNQSGSESAGDDTQSPTDSDPGAQTPTTHPPDKPAPITVSDQVRRRYVEERRRADGTKQS